MQLELLKHPPTLMVWKWVLVQSQHSSHCCVVLATIANDELHTFSVVPAKHVKPREGTSAELFTPADARVNADRSRSRSRGLEVEDQAQLLEGYRWFRLSIFVQVVKRPWMRALCKWNQ